MQFLHLRGLYFKNFQSIQKIHLIASCNDPKKIAKHKNVSNRKIQKSIMLKKYTTNIPGNAVLFISELIFLFTKTAMPNPTIKYTKIKIMSFSFFDVILLHMVKYFLKLNIYILNMSKTPQLCMRGALKMYILIYLIPFSYV